MCLLKQVASNCFTELHTMGLPKHMHKYNIIRWNTCPVQISDPLEQCLHQRLVVGLSCSIEYKENLKVYFKRKKYVTNKF
jgi:hypothetical protein